MARYNTLTADMSPATPLNTKLATALILALGAVIIGYHLASRTLQPLTSEFSFTDSKESIKATGLWQLTGSTPPNATRIFCWFPTGTCDLVVAELLPPSTSLRFHIVDRVFNITQLIALMVSYHSRRCSFR